MLERENHMVDSALLATLIRSVSFLSSGTLILIADLSTALTAADQNTWLPIRSSLSGLVLTPDAVNSCHHAGSGCPISTRVLF